MKPSRESALENSETDELDAGWGDPETAKPAAVAPPGNRSVVAPAPLRAAPASTPAPVDDLDDGWDDDEDDDEELVAPSPVAVTSRDAVAPAKSARAPRAPAERVVSGMRRTLSKKERRELERKNKTLRAQKSSARKQSRREGRREKAQKLAEEREQQRREELARAKQQKQEQRRQAQQRRPKRAEAVEQAARREEDSALAKPAKRSAKANPKHTGGGWIVALIALITLGTAIFAWSRR